MNLSKIMGSMTLRERRMLNEAVKQRIVETAWDKSSVEYLRAAFELAEASYDRSKTSENKALADSAYNAYVTADRAAKGDTSETTKSAPPLATEPSDQSFIGSTLFKDGKVVFVLTEEGWKTTLRISEEQILALVIPAVQEELKKQMRAAKGQGDELHIVKSSLTDQGAANKSNELFLKRDGEEFADPVEIPVDKMKAIMTRRSLVYVNGTDPNRQYTPAKTAHDRSMHDFISIGAAIIRFQDAEGDTELIVLKDKLSGFDDLFGTSNSRKITLAIQKAQDAKAAALQKDAGKKVKREYPESFKIPLSYAVDGSIMKYMSDSVLRGVGIGKVEFKLLGDSYYKASVKLSKSEIAALNAKLVARTAANASAP